MAGGHKPIRLPPLQTLRVKDPKRAPENPCIAIMTSVLGMFPPRITVFFQRAHLTLALDPTRLGHDSILHRALLTLLLACWASAGYNAAGCTAIENQLRKCMDGPPLPPAPANTINYHLGRMQKHVISRGKQ